MSDVDDKLNEKLASAWRDASREEPPAALDASLRAAARRAVRAGPSVASQERHMRSWPLATAAVLAVLSFGILQLTPPEEVTPGMVAENSVRSPVTRQVEPAAPAAEPASRPAAAPPSAPASMAGAGPAPASPSASDARNAPPYAQRDSATGTATGRITESLSTPAPGAEKKVFRENAPEGDAERDRGAARTQFAHAPAPPSAPPASTATAPAKEELAKDKQNQSRVDALATLEAREHTELAATRSRLASKNDKALAAEPAASAGGPAAAPPAAPAASAPPAMAPAPRPDPFPAAGSANTKAIETEPRPPVQAGAVAPARSAPPPQERAKLGAADSTDAPTAAAAAGAAKPQTNVETRRAEQMQSAAPAPLAKSAVPADAVKDAPIKPPEEWIKLIRKLRSEGRSDDAARELAAFRAAYKERADALLPADLRAAPR